MTHVSIWMKYIKQPLWRHIEIARTMISCSCEIAPKIYIIFVTHITVNVSNGFHFHPPTTSMRCFWLLFVCLTYQPVKNPHEIRRVKDRKIVHPSLNAVCFVCFWMWMCSYYFIRGCRLSTGKLLADTASDYLKKTNIMMEIGYGEW